MAELTDIYDVGPAYAEKLEDAGYADVGDVASADPDEVDEVIQAYNGVDLVDAAQDALDDDVEEVEYEGDDSTNEAHDRVELYPEFSEMQEHTLMKALINEKIQAQRRHNKSRREAAHDAIQRVRNGEPYHFTIEQLSISYTGVKQLESEYRGTSGLSTFVGDVRDITEYFQGKRTEHWPEDA